MLLGNLYLILLAAISYLFFTWYVAKSDRFRRVSKIILYTLPFIYLTITLLLIINVFKSITITQNILSLIFTPFIIMSALAMAEGKHRFILQSNEYVPDAQKYLKTKKADLKNIPKYKEFLIKEGYDIKKWSDEKIFDKAREIEYQRILKIKKGRKK